MADQSLSKDIPCHRSSETSRWEAGRDLRLLIVAPSQDLPGGQSNHAAQLYMELSKEPPLGVSFLPLNPSAPIPLRMLQQVKYLRTIITSLMYCSRLLTRVPLYDVIHVYSASASSFFISSMPAMLIAKMFRRKVVLNYHSGRAEQQFRDWRRTTIAALKLADAIVVPSGFLANVFARHGLQAKVVANHVDTMRFRFRDHGVLRPNFIANRHFYPIYNLPCVLRAFAVIQSRYPTARLTLVGDGPQGELLVGLARRLGLESVDFVGFVSPDRMPSYYDAADIYLNASNADNMPLSILEAFSAGLPVVSTNAGGIPYLISHEETGLLIPLNDHMAMAAAAIRLLEDRDLAATITRRALQSCDNYTWKRVRPEWLRLYTALAQRQSGG
jgi:glycosyltransferase involved in cell wall biosynthesis